MKFKLKFFIAWVVITIASQGIFTSLHESAHVAIAENFECENVYTEYSLFNAVTHSTCELPRNELLILRGAQSDVEVFGYQLQAIMYVILFSTLLIGLTLQRND